jgi:hypothetical protein
MHTLGRRYCNKSCWRRTRRLLERRKCPALSARELLSRVYQYQSTRHGSTMDACTQSAHIPSYAPHILWCVWTCGVKLTSIALTSPLPTAIHRSYRPDHRGEHLPLTCNPRVHTCQRQTLWDSGSGQKCKLIPKCAPCV